MVTRTFLQLKSDLQSSGVTSSAALNSTIGYAALWTSGDTFDLEKSSIKVVRARLRKVGVDIGKPFDGSLSIKVD